MRNPNQFGDVILLKGIATIHYRTIILRVRYVNSVTKQPTFYETLIRPFDQSSPPPYELVMPYSNERELNDGHYEAVFPLAGEDEDAVAVDGDRDQVSDQIAQEDDFAYGKSLEEEREEEQMQEKAASFTSKIFSVTATPPALLISKSALCGNRFFVELPPTDDYLGLANR